MGDTGLHTLIVPLDGSDLSARVLPLAAEQARRLDARIVLLSVPHTPGPGLATVPDADLHFATVSHSTTVADSFEAARRETSERLEESAEALRAEGLETECLLPDEPPARAILETAPAYPDSLVVMATHGRSGFERLLFGSVAEKVVNASRRPLLLVPSRAETVPTLLETAVVALDGSEAAESVLRFLVPLARANGTQVVLAHVAPDFANIVRSEGALLSKIERSYESWIDRTMRRWMDDLSEEGVEARPSTLTGSNVVAALLDALDERRPDVVAVTTHGRGGPGHWPLGSVASRLIRASATPMLIERVSG
jgi:nucleotide-binding universal stress UspA family protein